MCEKSFMPQFTHIIFDLDGTLTDNTKGIENSVKYALQKLHIEEIPENLPQQFIGPPLQWGFQNIFGLNERNTQLAVEYFREYYGENGWKENIPYAGIAEMLEELHLSGKKLFVATSKLEKYAEKIIRHFEFDRYIDRLIGADYSGNKGTKGGIISQILENHGIVSSAKIAMVGDTVFDMEGGKENGISTVAVSYGFGDITELQQCNPDYFADSVEELFEILNG